MSQPLRINTQQAQGLSDEHFFARIDRILGEIDPQAPAVLKTAQGRRQLRELVGRAQGYGLQAELDVGRFIISAWVLGLDFDTRFPAMKDILTEPRLSSTQKADALEKLTSTMMDMLQQGRTN
jgi:hypothetical protein